MSRVGELTVWVLALALLGGACPANAQTTITGGSELLTQAHANQLGAWLGEGPITIKRIYTKTPGDSGSVFHGVVDGKGRTFSVLEMVGNLGTRVIGGYNPQSWGGESINTEADQDRTAFIFNLSTGVKYDQKKTTDANGPDPGRLQTGPGGGPTFGGGADLGVLYGSDSFGMKQVYCYTYSYGKDVPQAGTNIYGDGNYNPVPLGRMEVFTISTESASAAAVPESRSLLLFLPALAVLAFLKRRPTS